MEVHGELVSVIIPTYNRVNDIVKLVDSLLESEYKDIEIIVVDNNSTDGTTETLINNYVAKGLAVQVIALNTNMMAAGGRNAGIRKAKGQYFLFIDSDNIVPPNMIGALIKGFEENPGLGFLGPVSINARKNNTIFCLGFHHNFWTSMSYNLHEGKRLDEIEVMPYYKTTGLPNAFMVTKVVINKIGGFDESYYIMYEETDFGYRIKKSGYESLVTTKAVIYHQATVGQRQPVRLRNLGIETPERAYHFAKNRSMFMKKYAPWYCMIGYYLFFIHVFFLFYFVSSVLAGRFDIALAFLKGSWEGVFYKPDCRIKIKL